MLDVLGFNVRALNVLQENNITSLNHLINTRRVTFDVLNHENKGFFNNRCGTDPNLQGKQAIKVNYPQTGPGDSHLKFLIKL